MNHDLIVGAASLGGWQEARPPSGSEVMLFAVGIVLLLCAVVLLLLWDIGQAPRIEEQRTAAMVAEFVRAVGTGDFEAAELAAERAFHTAIEVCPAGAWPTSEPSPERGQR